MDRQAVKKTGHRLTVRYLESLGLVIGLSLVAGCGPGESGPTVAENDTGANAGGSAGVGGAGVAAGGGASTGSSGASRTSVDAGVDIGSHATEVYTACHESCVRQDQAAQDLQCGDNQTLCESNCTALEAAVAEEPIACFKPALALEKCVAALPLSSYACSQGFVVVSQQKCDTWQKAYDVCLAGN